jgi:FkbM family methyltransferase
MPFGRDVWLDVARLSERWGAPITCVFDVGANSGQTSRIIHDRFPDARVCAFEPHPDTFKRLTRELKGCHAEAFNIALSDRSGEAELFTYETDQINSLTAMSPSAVRFGKVGKSMPVQILTVDEFCSLHNIHTIDVLKVDVEGCEMAVLKGAAGVLEAGKVRFVYTEFNDIFERGGRTGGALSPIAAYVETFGLHFVASYTDDVVTEGELFGVHNALFAASPQKRQP